MIIVIVAIVIAANIGICSIFIEEMQMQSLEPEKTEKLDVLVQSVSPGSCQFCRTLLVKDSLSSEFGDWCPNEKCLFIDNSIRRKKNAQITS
jgi:hypothetical protein